MCLLLCSLVLRRGFLIQCAIPILKLFCSYHIYVGWGHCCYRNNNLVYLILHWFLLCTGRRMIFILFGILFHFYKTYLIHSKTMLNFGKLYCSIFDTLNLIHMFWAHVISRMQEFPYQSYHGWRCIDICDCVNGWASISSISALDQPAKGPNSAMNMP